MTDEPLEYTSITLYVDEVPPGAIDGEELLDRIRFDGADATENFRIRTPDGDIVVTAEDGKIVFREDSE